MNYFQRKANSFDNHEIILQSDDRKKVSNSTAPPFRWICSLEVEFPEPVLYPLGTLEHPGKAWKDLKPTIKGCGSGLLITPKHVLTASHVIAGLKIINDNRTGKPIFKIVPAKKVTVIPARNEINGRNQRPFGIYTSQKVFISPGFIKALQLPFGQLTINQVRQALASDYGIVEIREKHNNKSTVPGQTAGWWRELDQFKILPVDKQISTKLEKRKIHVCGYPGDKGKIPCSTMWRSYDKVKKVFPSFNGKSVNLIFYQADTSAGMSGSPVWMRDTRGKHYLIAIHSSFLSYLDKTTKQKEKVNVGALITKETIRQLRAWKVEYLEVLFPNLIGLRQS